MSEISSSKRKMVHFPTIVVFGSENDGRRVFKRTKYFPTTQLDQIHFEKTLRSQPTRLTTTNSVVVAVLTTTMPSEIVLGTRASCAVYFPPFHHNFGNFSCLCNRITAEINSITRSFVLKQNSKNFYPKRTKNTNKQC